MTMSFCYLRYLLFLVFVLPLSCTNHDEPVRGDWDTLPELHDYNQGKITLEQGYAGTLILKEGNCMPMVGVGLPGNTCRSYPVKRTIRIYDYTLQEETEGDGPFFTLVNALLRERVTTDHEGFFQVELPPGNYSVFIEEAGKLYANLWDGQGGIHPITVAADSIGYEQLTLDYAVY